MISLLLIVLLYKLVTLHVREVYTGKVVDDWLIPHWGKRYRPCNRQGEPDTEGWFEVEVTGLFFSWVHFGTCDMTTIRPRWYDGIS